MPDKSKCAELRKQMASNIQDEIDAQKAYNQLAVLVEQVLCGGMCAQGVMASDGVLMVATDEKKHEKFDRQLLEQIDKVCPP